jgi:transcriptional regulator with XRE-family HTH domain
MDERLRVALRAELALFQLTQADLARRVGVSAALVSLILSGQRAVSPDLRARLFLGVHQPLLDEAERHRAARGTIAA